MPSVSERMRESEEKRGGRSSLEMFMIKRGVRCHLPSFDYRLLYGNIRWVQQKKGRRMGWKWVKKKATGSIPYLKEQCDPQWSKVKRIISSTAFVYVVYTVTHSSSSENISMVEQIVLLRSTFYHITSWKIEQICTGRFFWHARQVEPMSTFICISIHYYYYGTPTPHASSSDWYDHYIRRLCWFIHACLYRIKAAPAKQIYRELKMENICSSLHTAQYTPESIAHFSYRQESAPKKAI